MGRGPRVRDDISCSAESWLVSARVGLPVGVDDIRPADNVPVREVIASAIGEVMGSREGPALGSPVGAFEMQMYE